MEHSTKSPVAPKSLQRIYVNLSSVPSLLLIPAILVQQYHTCLVKADGNFDEVSVYIKIARFLAYETFLVMVYVQENINFLGIRPFCIFFFRKSAVYLIHVRCVNHCHRKTNNLAIKLLEAVSTNQSPVQQIVNVARGYHPPGGVLKTVLYREGFCSEVLPA